MKLYVKVSDDKYELPEAVAESPIELSKMLGYGRNYAYNIIERARKSGKKPKVVVVEIEEEQHEISNDRRNGAERSGKGA